MPKATEDTTMTLAVSTVNLPRPAKLLVRYLLLDRRFLCLIRRFSRFLLFLLFLLITFSFSYVSSSSLVNRKAPTGQAQEGGLTSFGFLQVPLTPQGTPSASPPSLACAFACISVRFSISHIFGVPPVPSVSIQP